MSTSRSSDRAPGARVLRAVKGLLVSVAEMALAVAIVLVFALIFMGILVLSFPEGTGLVDFYDDLVHDEARSRPRWPGHAGSADDAFVAVLSDVVRRVRDRPATAIAWNEAHQGMRLRDLHTVQTLSRSGATIAFGEKGKLRLGERSLVVVKHEDRRYGLRERQQAVLLGGRIEGRLAAGSGRSAHFGVVTPGGTTEIRSQGARDAEFVVQVNPDRSSTLSIFCGVAEIATAMGSITVGPDQAITLDPTGRLGAAVAVPDPPALLAPPDGHLHAFGEIAPRIEFRWAEIATATAFRFELARDGGFEDLVYSAELGQTAFVHGDLASGRYFWRVSSLSGRAESRPGTPRSFRLVQDHEPPDLHVVLPEVAFADRLLIRGMAEPGAELFIESAAVPLAAGGEFEYTLTLDPGLNMIVIEAIDTAGNSAYLSRYVTARF